MVGCSDGGRAPAALRPASGLRPVGIQPRLLAAVDEVLAALSDPGVRLVTVVGPAGAGRSTVLAATVARLRRRGMDREQVGVDVVPGARTADAGGGSVIPLDDTRVVDDIHLADPGDLVALRRLCATDDAVRVVLSTPEGARVPEEVAALRQDLPSRVVRIGPLDVVDVLTLATDLLGEPLAGDSAARIQRDTGGRPGLVLQLCRQAALDGAFRRDPSGRLRLAGDPPIPWALTVGGLTSAVPEDVQAVLRLLAVADGPVQIETVERLLGPEAVERAVATSTVVAEHAGACSRLAHASPWVGAGIRATLPAPVKRDLLRGLAAASPEPGPPADPDRVQVLRWLLRAGDCPPAGMLEDAVAAACRHGDVRLAEELLRLAGDTGVREPETREAVRLMRRRNGVAPWRQGARATRHAVQAVVDGALELYLNHGRMADAERIARAVSATLPASSQVGIGLTALRASILLSTNRVDEALTASASLPLDRVETLALRLATLMRAGRPVDAVHLSRRLTQLDLGSQRYGHFRHTVYSYSAIASAHAGGLRAARRRARRQYELALMDERPVAAASWAFALSAIEQLAGCPRSAATVAFDGVALMDEVQCGGGPAVQALGLVVLARAELDLGAVDDARESLARIEAIGAGVERLSVVDSVRGLLTHADGDNIGARAQLLRSARGSAAVGAHQDASWAYLHLAQVGGAREAARHMAATARRLQGPALLGMYDAVRAMAVGSGEALDRVADRMAYLGLGGVGAAVAAARARPEAVVDGSAVTESGQRDVRGHRTTGANGHVAGVSERLAALTVRQRQVVALVADGLSNAEAAGRMGLSRRTVEVHLQLAYDKLGVHDRRALTRMSGLAGSLGTDSREAVGT